MGAVPLGLTWSLCCLRSYYDESRLSHPNISFTKSSLAEENLNVGMCSNCALVCQWRFYSRRESISIMKSFNVFVEDNTAKNR